MAKVKGIFSTQLKGKVGPVVYRNTPNGQTVSQRPANVKNPKTYAQMWQRMKMSTIQKAYSGLKGIVDHSWEGVQYGQKSMSEFTKRNFDTIAGGQGAFMALPDLIGATPSDWLISDGSIAFSNFNDTVTTYEKMNLTGEDSPAPVFVVPGTFADITCEQFIKAVGAEVGDIITFVAVVKEVNSSSVGDDVTQYPSVMRAARIEIRALDSDLASEKMFNGNKLSEEAVGIFKVANAEYIDGVDSINIADLRVEANASGNNSVYIAFAPMKAGDQLFSLGYILSRKADSGWKRSTSKLYHAISRDPNYLGKNVIGAYGIGSTKYLNGGRAADE